MLGSTGDSGSSKNLNQGSFAEEFERSMQERLDRVRPGRVVTGTIVGINKEVVTIDIGFKSEGVIPVQQFYNTEGKIEALIGDSVDVFIVSLEGDNGQVSISKEKADQKRIWEGVEETFRSGGLITGTVVQKVKGGLQVDIGIPAFLPGSQIDVRPHRNLDKFLGQFFDFKVIKVTRDKGNIVLSRRAVLVSERDRQRSETLKVLGEGIVMEGVVKNVTEYGAFVDLGGIDGLLHVTDISWGRVNHPSEKLSVGQNIPVVILKYDSEKERVSLGMKQLKEDPWLTVHERYPIGGKVNGKVVSLADYGAFIELEEGVEGLIHVSEMSWTKKVRHPSKLLAEGQRVEAQILGIDSQERRISLGLKQLTPNPWQELIMRHPPRSRVKGKIRSITDFGIFVEVEEGIDGLVHVSDFSWTKRISDPREILAMYKKGDEVEAIVLDVDPENERLSLGIKQLTPDPWDSIPQRFPVGLKVRGPIRGIQDYGLFVEIEDGLEGLVHRSHLGLKGGAKIDEAYKVGQEIDAEVIAVDREARRINLSMKNLVERRVPDEYSQYVDSSEREQTGGQSFGELLERAIGPKDE